MMEQLRKGRDREQICSAVERALEAVPDGQWNAAILSSTPDMRWKRILAFIKELGYQASRTIIKTDQESPITAVADKLQTGEGQGRGPHDRLEFAGEVLGQQRGDRKGRQ